MTIRAEGIDRLESLLEGGIESEVFSGAALAVGTSDGTAARVLVGHCDIDGRPITQATRFDLASVTKAVSTTTLLLRLVERGQVALDAPIGEYLEGLSGTEREAIPVRSLLSHTSGLPPYKSFPFGWESRKALLKSLYDSPLSILAPPDKLYVYSDLNFVLLGELVRTVGSDSLATAFDASVATPLGLDQTTFGPLEDGVPVAATRDRRWRNRVLHGEIHDYMGAIMEGESGNSGLFSSVGDLATIAGMLLNGGQLAGERILAPSTIETLREDAVPSIDERHGLGWRLGTQTRPAAGWSEQAFGHTGFTGTSIWLDPQLDVFVVLLTNRLLMTDDAAPIHRLRTRVHEVAVAAVDDATPTET